MLNAGRVFSRTIIIEMFWDQSFDGIKKIVDVTFDIQRDGFDDAHVRKIIKSGSRLATLLVARGVIVENRILAPATSEKQL